MKGHNLLVLNVVDSKMLQENMPIVKVNGVQNYTDPLTFIVWTINLIFCVIELLQLHTVIKLWNIFG